MDKRTPVSNAISKQRKMRHLAFVATVRYFYFTGGITADSLLNKGISRYEHQRLSASKGLERE
ncbi:hypothetical protein [Erwinia sp. JUb26]|uniref:hypothetical protein n=1 Tax=Erwinia sp. JUb26 TaxID=2485126 RepID=UPI001315252F|nr:hypothetical protein [Erwinia sp. JUb26]